MENVANIIDRYTAELSPSDKKRLLMAYYDYISLVGNLEDIIAKQGVKHLALYEVMRNQINQFDVSLWDVEKTTKDERELWQTFVNGESIKDSKDFCFVSVNHTSQRYRDESSGILSIPAGFKAQRRGNPLPHRIERYVAAYPENIKLKDAKFIVDGKHVLYYNVADAEQTVDKAFEEESFKDNFTHMLDVLSQISDEIGHTDRKVLRLIEKDVMASATVAPLENLILDTLSILSDEAHQIIKKVTGKRTGVNYWGQAEREHIIPSAVRMQDYINIRHLLRHQWDTLDGMGKFNEKEALKNSTVRRRFLDSYVKLCDKPLKERVKAYIQAGNDFVPLVTRLNPFVFVKNKDESNNKFVERIALYCQENPEQKLFIETGVHYNEDKKRALINKLAHVSDNFELIDKGVENISDLKQRFDGFTLRRLYLEIFSDIEYRICQYALFSGQNMTAAYAWNWLKVHKVITPSEAEAWAEYRKMRNQLSHKYTDDALNQQIMEIISDFSVKAKDLVVRINESMPEVRMVADNIYEAVHQNGKVVRLDYKNKLILSNKKQGHHGQKAAKSQVKGQEGQNTKRTKSYTEEYPNGVSLTIAGTDIVSCRLNTGVTVDLDKNQLNFDDGTKMYYASEQGIQIIYAGQERIFADKTMTVHKCVKDGKIIFLHSNDRVMMSNRRSVMLGKNEEIKEESWYKNDGQKMMVRYVRDREDMFLHFNDGTSVLIKPNATKVWHNGVELGYAKRQIFADSYSDDGAESGISKSVMATFGQQK